MSGETQKEAGLHVAEIPLPENLAPNSARIVHGRLIPPQQQILLYSGAEWEAFIQEWAHHQKTRYQKVVRFSGANDMGIDVAGLTDDSGIKGAWDNYQCKHYNKPLTPGVAIPEIAKMLWHGFNGSFAIPQKYYFMAPKDCGMSLRKLLLDPAGLKSKLFEVWDDSCAGAITSKQRVLLEGKFREYVDGLDFTIFTFKTALETIEDHKRTPYHAARFGGGLPERPNVEEPPLEPAVSESRYLKQLFGAYGNHKNSPIENANGLSDWPELAEHYRRQREFFYHAESLRNFARDNVPPGTFEQLQGEVYAGVADIHASPHHDAFVCLNATTQAAAQLSITSNGLISVTRIQDKRGICHQLANDDKLLWVKP